MAIYFIKLKPEIIWQPLIRTQCDIKKVKLKKNSSMLCTKFN